MKICYTQSFRDDIPGHVVVDHEDGTDLEIHNAYQHEAAALIAKLKIEYAKADKSKVETRGE